MNKFLFLLFFPFILSAQLKGEVFDAETRKPIPYVNIWVEGEQIGTNSEENGSFSLNISEEKNIVFSSLGYETKTISSKEITKVYLQPTAIQLQEIVLEKPKKKNQIKYGSLKPKGAFLYYPLEITARYFPYQDKFEKTKFLKEVVFFTKCEIDSALFKIRIFSVDEKGYPKDDLVSEDILKYAKKGKNNTVINLEEYNLVFPKNGIFIAIEKLQIERNQFEVDLKDATGKNSQKYIMYYPDFKYNWVDDENTFSFRDGKWIKQQKYKYKGGSNDLAIFEPQFYIVLTD